MISPSDLPPVIMQSVGLLGITLGLLALIVIKNSQEIKKLKSSNQKVKESKVDVG